MEVFGLPDERQADGPESSPSEMWGRDWCEFSHLKVWKIALFGTK